MKKVFAFAGALFSILYIVSPVDLIPEVIFPFGLLDDAAMIPILLSCLKVLGLDLTRLLGRKSTSEPMKNPSTSEKKDEKVIDID